MSRICSIAPSRWMGTPVAVCAMIFLMASAAHSLGQFPPPGGGFRFGPPGSEGGANLLALPEVKKELALTEDQIKQVDEVVSELRTKIRDSFQGINFQELRELEPEEVEAKFAEQRKKADAANKEGEEKGLAILNDDQRARFTELQLQREGAAALGRDDLAKTLNLTIEQAEKIKQLVSELPGPFGRFPGAPGGGPGPGRGPGGPGGGPGAPGGGPGGPGAPGGGFGPPDFEQIAKQRKEKEGEIVALLTDEQQAKWKAMQGKEFKFPEPQNGMFGGPRGFGPMAQERKLLKSHDADKNGWLNREERAAARESLKKEPNAGGPAGGFGPPGGPGGFPFGNRGGEPPKPGKHISQGEVTPLGNESLYDESILRTVFLDFEEQDWEKELEEFHGSDVDVAATLTVDGKRYEGVGVHFRGMSSYGMVSSGYKRSLNVTMDLVHSDQRLLGYKSLNLLNSHEDPSLVSTVLFSHIARNYIPAPQANFVRVVINGENWGIYVNAEQFDKKFLEDHYQSTGGARWKVPGSPMGRGGMEYIGDKIDDYKQRFEAKGKVTDTAWKDLIHLCRVLNETPVEKLEEAITPILDVDGLLWFLALDVTLTNNDGYWIRASDYSIYQDESGKFHVIPHDMNEAFHGGMEFMFGGGRPGGPAGFGPPGGGPRGRARPAQEGEEKQGEEKSAPDKQQASKVEDSDNKKQDQAPGRRGGRRERGPGGPMGGPFGPLSVKIDPLVGMEDAAKPLRSKILKVPAFRQRYLEHVKTIAEDWLAWEKLEPIVTAYKNLIDEELQQDTRKIDSYDDFMQAFATQLSPANAEEGGRPGRLSLKEFAQGRREYLLSHEAIKQLGQAPAEPSAPQEK